MGSSVPVTPGGKTTSWRMRDAKLHDAIAVQRLLESLGYPCDEADAERRIRRVNASPRQSLIVAEQKEQVIGMISLDFMFYLPLGRETCRITALVVDENFRKQQVGRDLLRFAEGIARREGAIRIELTTAAQRTDAHRFYAASGYSQSSLRFVKNLCEA
ncbi:MAG: GNAT family N-acetyltransferase [Pseudomonadota bacterium]|nr:GNAT family N-acetyltransferase [Pseudomonadota bacterium]